MKVVFRVMACLVIVSCLPLMAEGQGAVDPSRLFGIPSFLSSDPLPPRAAGASSNQSPPILPPELRASYMRIQANAFFDLKDAGGLLLGARHRYLCEGVSFEITQRGFLSQNTGVFGVASYLDPTSQTIAEDYAFLFGNQQLDWSMNTQLWTGGAGITYNWADSLTLIGGANYISFDLKFVNILASTGAGGMINPESFCEVRAVTPYIGVVVNQNSSQEQFSIGFLLCPAMLGTMEYYLAAAPANSPSRISGRFQNSRFCVVMAEYGRNVPWGNIGAFIRWTPLHGEFLLTFSKNPTFPVALRDGASEVFSADVLNAGVKCMLLFPSLL